MVGQGDAVGSINVRLSTVKAYNKLATKAGVLSAEELAMIRTVAGYAHKEARRIDERRETARRGNKKSAAVHITTRQAKKLKSQPDTPQGRRDALLMCLLLDHGLRVGEVARLQVADFDLKAGEMRFMRPKVDKVQTHKISADSIRTLRWRVALAAAYYNFCRTHHALRIELGGGRYRRHNPAMVLGITGHPWSMQEFITHPVY